MEHLVIAFRSRAHTVRFSNYLRKNGLPNLIVNTPKEAGVGCGLSVELEKKYLQTIKMLVKRFESDSFAGIFLVYQGKGRRIVRSI